MARDLKLQRKAKTVLVKALFCLAEKIADKYSHNAGPEAALYIAIIAQAIQDGATDYFNDVVEVRPGVYSTMFGYHWDLIPENFRFEEDERGKGLYYPMATTCLEMIRSGSKERFIRGCNTLLGGKL
jgi:hypothetical protein